jgi:uncharacterized protein with PIN domain
MRSTINNRTCFALFAFFAANCLPAFAQAGVSSTAVRETVEYLSKKFGKEMAETTVETVTRKVETLAAKYGDNALTATRKVGPQALKYADEAGDLAGDSLRIMSRYGDDAIRIVSKPAVLQLAAKYGDDATEAIVKYGPDMMTPVLSKYGDDAARAMNKLSRNEAIELATKISDDQFAKLAAPQKLLNVVGQYGDNAMVFINKHWKALAVGTVCLAFVNDPEPFINGTKELVVDGADVIGRNVVKPLAEGVASGTNWTIFLGIVAVGILGLITYKIYLKQRAAAKTAA